jgi:hypothetical protein
MCVRACVPDTDNESNDISGEIMSTSACFLCDALNGRLTNLFLTEENII